MNARRLTPVLAVLVAAGLFTLACSQTAPEPAPEPTPEPALDTLVTAEWLQEHLGEPDLVVLDCTVTLKQGEDGSMEMMSGRAAYDAGHIPAAGFADLTGALADGASPYHFAMPTPEHFRAAMEALGVGDDTRVVLYDAMGLGWATRVWWMLRWIGFDRAAVLDGGLAAWTAAGGELSTEQIERPAGTITPALRPELIADRAEVLAAVGAGDVWLVDAMPEAHFRGEMSMYGRPGHIPGATNIPAMSLLDESGGYRSADELTAVFDRDHAARTITYCGGGIAASSVAFVMTRLGYTDVAVYTASLQEWVTDPDNPLETAEPSSSPAAGG